MTALVLGAADCAAEPSAPASPAAGAATTATPAPEEAVRRLTPEQLVAAALTAEAVSGSYANPVSVLERGDDDPEVEPPSEPACVPSLDALGARSAPGAAGQTFNWKGDVYGGETVLASYEGTGAQEAFAAVGEGLKTCRYYEQGRAGLYKGAVTLGAAPGVGDESARFEISAPSEAGPHVTEYTVVRVGNTVAAFSKLSVAGHTVRSFPDGLIAKQADRLRQAQN
ncbi:hypothetical protein [Streptomyces sp. NPDC012825]|uniref:hypothetical protein n=1 Tax=Streptomyces sp. NPDC012825 TaxID=3364851 RepID=UPI0036999FD6